MLTQRRNQWRSKDLLVGDKVCPGGAGPGPHDPCHPRGGGGPAGTPAQTLRILQSQQTPGQSAVYQIPLAFKVIFPAYFQFLYLIPRLGNLLWALEFSQQCENFFGIIVLQFVGPLLSGSMVELMATSFKRAYGTDSASRSAAARAPVPAAGHC